MKLFNGLCCVVVCLLFSSCKSFESKKVVQGGNSNNKYAFVGTDKFWRPRQSMVFYFYDQKGTGFDVNLTVRDMNVYQEGKRPAYAFVVGPKGKIVNKIFIPDDGIVRNNPKYKDGIFDIGMDFRYREYHRKNSPGGVSPGKERSSYLTNPETIPARTFTIKVPANGNGLYRLYVGACWDYWLSVKPSRPIATGIYPGPGAFYVHKDQLKNAYLYLPENVQDIGFMVSEEIEPFNWKLTVNDEAGRRIAQTTSRTFYNYDVWRNAKGGQVLQISLKGKTAGACLNITGVPFILFPDKDTAAKAKAGLSKGVFFDNDQETIINWAMSLKPEELRINVKKPALKKIGRVKLSEIAKIVDTQDINRLSSKYGTLKNRWGIRKLLTAATSNLHGNTYYNNSALMKRILLDICMRKFKGFGPNFSFDRHEAPRKISKRAENWLERSSWWPLLDGIHASTLEKLKNKLPVVVPFKVIAAMKNLFVKWSLARMVMEQGICSNQWSYELKDMAAAYKFTDDSDIKKVLDFQVKRFCTSNNLGRTNPDKTNYSLKSNVCHSWPSDTGTIGGAVPAEIFGHDNEYALESCANMAAVWGKIKYPEIVQWLKQYYILKTHLTISKYSTVPKICFSQTCSPTDFNSRTRYYTHKSNIGNIHDLIPYGRLWTGKKDVKQWPFMEKKPFVRNIDNLYFFVKTPRYYAILYGGPSQPEYLTWMQSKKHNNSKEYIGFKGVWYGGYQYKASKPGGISAIWVNGCGPVLLGNNHNVMYTNNTWGRISKSICAEQGKNINPYVVSGAYDSPIVGFDKSKRIMTKAGRILRTPLKYKRTIVLKDKKIIVTLELKSKKDFIFKELYEAIPVFVDGKNIAVNGKTVKLPKSIVTSTHACSMDKKQWGYNSVIPEYFGNKLSVTVKSGRGAIIKFNKNYKIKFAQPLRYRSIASTMTGANIALPLKWKAGESYTLTYAINL